VVKPYSKEKSRRCLIFLIHLSIVVLVDGRKTKCGIIAIKAIKASNLQMIH